jgi:type IV pilus assembly protein PilF
LNENPDLGDAHMAMGVVYERLDDPDKAREHYRRAVELEPDNSSALNNYGRFLCDRGEYDHAEELFKKSAANPLYESPEVPLANAGLCAERAGRHQKAEDYFLKALRSNKRFPVALLNMAELRLDQGEPMSARGYYERYLSAAQQTARSLWLGIRIEHQLENPDAVASYSLLLRQKFPDSAQASELLEWERNGKL